MSILDELGSSQPVEQRTVGGALPTGAPATGTAPTGILSEPALRATPTALGPQHAALSDATGLDLPRRIRSWPWLVVGSIAVVIAMVMGSVMGPAGLPVADVIRELVGMTSSLSPLQHDVLWQIRMPRVVLGALVGGALAAGGVAYQGVFRNPLADPYLLGVAAGAGLGATLSYTSVLSGWGLAALPVLAFSGAVLAVVCTYSIGSLGRASTATLILAGVAVAAFFTAIQTYLLQKNSDTLRGVYGWLLGNLAVSGWSSVLTVAPYILVAIGVLIVLGRHLDILQVGDTEARSLGINPQRVRLLVVAAATLATAAAVAVSGLIGFVGIVVPHFVRLISGGAHRRLMPLSILVGAAFLMLTDLLARTILAPAELPIGVITAFLGAPFFLYVLRRRGTVMQ